MNILVCVKQVVRICGQGGIRAGTGGVDPDSLAHMLNPCDEVAVEEALRIREKMGEGSVTVVTAGPARTDEALRWCLSMGVDSAYHIVNEEADDLDTWGTAMNLARFLTSMEYDLILFGKQTIDYGSGQVGTFVAELLGLPVVTSAVRIEFSADGRKATVESAMERGNRTVVETTLPAVLTVDKGMNRPRYPTLPGRLAARLTDVQQVKNTDLLPDGLGGDVHFRTTVVKIAPAKLRPKKILSPDSSLSPSEKLKFMMRGGMAEKKGDSVGGTPFQLVSGIIDFLKERKFIA